MLRIARSYQQTHRGRQYPVMRSISTPADFEEIIKMLVGSDGLERIEAIARLMPSGHTYRDSPHMLACHMLSLGIELAEKAVRQTLGIGE